MLKIGKQSGIYFLTFIILTTIYWGSFSTTKEVKASGLDQYDQIRENWKIKLLGGTTFDLTDTHIAEGIQLIEDTGQSHWDSMDKSSNRTYLWSDLDLTTAYSNNEKFEASYHIANSYRRLEAMALAYSHPESNLYENTQLGQDIVNGLEYMYQNWYNETKQSHTNTFNFTMGTPITLVNSTTLMYDELTTTQVNKYMDTITHFTPDLGNSTGANRTGKGKIIILRGVLKKNSSDIQMVQTGVEDAFNYVTSGDGFYEDGSFIQHTYHPNTGNYGRHQLKSAIIIMYLLDGSQWEITSSTKNNMFKWVFDSFEPVIYKGEFMDAVNGRQISTNYLQANHFLGHWIAGLITELTTFAPVEYVDRYKSMVKYWIEADTYANFYENATLEQIVLAKDIVANATSRGVLTGVWNYRGSDKIFQRTDNYAYMVSMHSKRISNYESINNENLKGWHHGDGMSFLYDSDLARYEDDFWPTVDSHRLPGTTVCYGETVPSGRSDQAWAGGVTFENKYATAGMMLHPKGSTLYATKSWFMLDDEIVAVGSNIDKSGTSSQPSNLASHAVDNNTDTRWCAKNFPQWIVVDLGQVYDINKIEVMPGWERDYKYEVLLSSDNNTFERIVDRTNNTQGGATLTDTFSTKTGRYVKLNVIGANSYSGSWVNIVEFKVFGPNNSSLNLALNKTVEYSEQQGGTSNVETIIENYGLNESGNNQFIVDGIVQSTNIGWNADLNNVSYMHLTGNEGNEIGYYFPVESTTIKAKRDVTSGRWYDLNSNYSGNDQIIRSKNYLTLWFDHGSNPQDERYAYVILPNKNQNNTAAYAQNPDIEIISHTNTVHAVKDTEENILAVNVFENVSTVVDYLSVNKKASIMVQEKDNVLTVAVSDPTQENSGSITVDIDKVGTLLSNDSGITMDNSVNHIRFSVNTNNAKGKTFTAKFVLEDNNPTVTLVGEDFEDGVIGQTPSSFTLNNHVTACEASIAADPADATNKVLYLYDNSPTSGVDLSYNTPENQIQLTKTFDSQSSGVIDFSWDIYKPNLTNNDFNSNAIVSGTEDIVFLEFTNYKQFRVAVEGKLSTKFDDKISHNQWITLRVIADLDTNIYSFYIDGEKICDRTMSQSYAIDAIRFNTSTKRHTEYYVDNLLIEVR